MCHMETVEFLILKNLLHNEEYVRKVIPFIKADYFEDRNQKIVFEEIIKFVEDYNKPATKEMGGGSGLKYAASTIIYLSKKKEKDKTEVVGNLIKAKTAKSRLSKENKQVEIRLFFDHRGLDRYYGLLELGEIGGLWKNVAGRYEIGGKKLYAKQILSEPETYFTNEVMQALDEIAKNEFSYGT